MENPYEANRQTQFVPSKTIKIFPENQGVDVRAQGNGVSRIMFHLPEYILFLNPETFRIRFNMKMSGRHMPKPSKVAGVSSIIRHMRVQTGNAMVLLEECDEYSTMVGIGYSYGQDLGIIQDREINEGLSLTDNPAQQLFWSARSLPDVGYETGTVAKNVAISMPLKSGLLGPTGTSILPLGAMGGCRITLETNTIRKSIVLANDASQGSTGELEVKTQVTAAAWTGDLNKVIGIECTLDATKVCRFEAGDSVYYVNAGGNTVLLGLVIGVQKDEADDVQLNVRGDVAASPATGPLLAAGTKLFTKNEDIYNGWTPGPNMVGGGAAPAASIVSANVAAKIKVDYVLSDVESICEQVSPPESYVNGLVSKLNSSAGLVMNYKNETLHKINLIGITGQLTASIPNTAKRVYSLLAAPINQNESFNANNITAPDTDFAQQYQWVINDQLVPDQRCSLRRMSLTPTPYVEQLHIQELRKGLMGAGVFVRSLQNANENFVIARQVAMYGSVSDITKSALSLRIEYSSQATRQKSLNVYVCSARTMIIRRGDVQVVY
tara:strand:+ start:139 stop:1791 length:1653 start_codon:yes stop_codon:yes gene_type:complete